MPESKKSVKKKKNVATKQRKNVMHTCSKEMKGIAQIVNRGISQPRDFENFHFKR